MNLISNFPVSIASGSQLYGPANVDDAAHQISITLARCTSATPTFWPNANTTVEAGLEISLDNGVNWQFIGAFGGQGGIYRQRDGAEVAASVGEFTLPPGTNRKIRAKVTVVNGPLASELTVGVI